MKKIFMKTLNICFPLQDDASTNKFLKMNLLSKDAVKSDLYFLLMTEKGERWRMPKFGTNLKRFIFEPSDTISEFDIKEDIKTTVKMYMPDLTIKDILFDYSQANTALITVLFTHSDRFNQEKDEVTLKFTTVN